MHRAVSAGSEHQVCIWKELLKGFNSREREGSGLPPREIGWQDLDLLKVSFSGPLIYELRET